VGVYLGCLFVTSLLAIPIVLAIPNKDDATFVASAVAAIGNILLLLLWLSRAHPGWQEMIGFPTRVWPEIRAGVGFGLLLYPGIAFGIGLVVSLIVSQLSGKPVSPPKQVPSDLTALGTVITVVYAVVIAPIHEELYFRGILFRTLRDRYGFGVGATFSGLAFGLIHYAGATASLASNLVLMLTMVFTGFALAYLYERRGNIVAPMFAHATFNTIGILLILFLR
jgi:membrane protease YdiL (CAAX protease family)